MNQLKVLAKRMNVRTGKLSQMLLPYGEETSTLEQAHASNVAEYAELAKLGLPADAAARLAALAADTRKLVRCKIADDNDIKAARCALETCRDFFDALEQLAALRRIPAFARITSRMREAMYALLGPHRDNCRQSANYRQPRSVSRRHFEAAYGGSCGTSDVATT